MRSAAAYTSKLKAQALGRTYKVQDTNHRLFTTTLYRGAVGCGPVNYAQIKYVESCSCDYIGPAKKYIPARALIYDGGGPGGSGTRLIDGGLVNNTGSVLNAGGPGSTGTQLIDGGLVNNTGSVLNAGGPGNSGTGVINAGGPGSTGTQLINGGFVNNTGSVLNAGGPG